MKQIILLDGEDLGKLKQGQTVQLTPTLMLGLERVRGPYHKVHKVEENGAPAQEADPLTKTTMLPCRYCHKRFKGRMGLGVHLANRHGKASTGKHYKGNEVPA